MTHLKEFSVAPARPLPILVLADVSGSMGENGKIDSLNDAMAEMIAAFAEESDARADIQVGVITFGGREAQLYQPFVSASKMKWPRMTAAGKTPFGAALELARSVIEDRQTLPSRAYRPTLVLASDGAPTDDWNEALDRLLSSERAAKAPRFALSIGDDAKRDVLSAFLAKPDARVFEAHEARQIKKFFRWVTMTVITRSRSVNPNDIVKMELTNLDEFEF